MIRVIEFEITVLTFGAIFGALEAASWALSGFTMSSALLHLIGAGLGLVLGVFWVKAQWVDCENWDLFSVLAGTQYGEEAARMGRTPLGERHRGNAHKHKRTNKHKYDSTEGPRAPTVHHLAPQIGSDVNAPPPPLKPKGKAQALQAITNALADNRYDDALELHQHARLIPGWSMPHELYIAFLKGISQSKKEAEAGEVMDDFLQEHPSSPQVDRVRLKRAQVLIQQERPRRAMAQLAQLDPTRLPSAWQHLPDQLHMRAKELLAEGAMELDE